MGKGGAKMVPCHENLKILRLLVQSSIIAFPPFLAQLLILNPPKKISIAIFFIEIIAFIMPISGNLYQYIKK